MVAAGGDAVFLLPDRRGRFVGRFRQRQRRCLTGLLQHGGHRLVDKIVYQPRLMETHLVLGGMNVDVHLVRVDFQIQHASGLLIVFS